MNYMNPQRYKNGDVKEPHHIIDVARKLEVKILFCNI